MVKGIFCLEGFWYGDHRDTTSVYPVLDLVHRHQSMPFVHHRCGSIDEFKFSIMRWKTKAFHKKYPLLYLAFHGEAGIIKIGKEVITLDQLAEMLEDKCAGVVIYFGSCSTIKLSKSKLQSFMEKTKTVAILGYMNDVNWLVSASFDIRLISYLLKHPFDSRGIQTIYEEFHGDCKGLIRELGFKMVPNERIWFPRKRKVKKVLTLAE